MAGLGTSDSRLIRVCVSRCEIDMVQIKEEFLKKYGEPLGKMIAVSWFSIVGRPLFIAVLLHFKLLHPLHPGGSVWWLPENYFGHCCWRGIQQINLGQCDASMNESGMTVQISSYLAQ